MPALLQVLADESRGALDPGTPAFRAMQRLQSIEKWGRTLSTNSDASQNAVRDLKKLQLGDTGSFRHGLIKDYLISLATNRGVDE